MHQKKNTTRMFGFGSNDETGTQIPTQAQSIVEGSGSVMVSEFKPVPDVDYLQVSVSESYIIVFFIFNGYETSNKLSPILKKRLKVLSILVNSYKTLNHNPFIFLDVTVVMQKNQRSGRIVMLAIFCKT